MGAERIPLDLWAFGYPNAVVEVRVAHTTTLAAIYSDEALTEAAENPVTLVPFYDADGNGYGKLEVPLYCGVPFELFVNSTDQSGVFRPGIVSLEGEDASLAEAKPRASTFLRPLTDHVGKEIHAADYGQLGISADLNTEIITTAIGQAAAYGGGYVVLPPGEIEITTLTLPQGVHLRGQGELTTFLISREATRLVTIAGDDAGLEHLTLDGVLLIANSVGVYADNKSVYFERCIIQRFEVGLHIRGGIHNHWNHLSIKSCQTGARLKGDLNTGSGSVGGPLVHLQWNGGHVETCLQFGIDIGFVDDLATNIALRDIHFDSNVDRAVRLQGAQFVEILRCNFADNGTPIDILDATPDEDDEINLTKTVAVNGSRFTTDTQSTLRFEGRCQDVVFTECWFGGITFEMDLPEQHVLLENCLNDAATTITGDSTKLISRTKADTGKTVGVTTDGTATKMWSTGLLEPGQMVMLDVSYIANGRNTNTKAKYRRIGTFRKPPSTLAYDGQTANFTVGLILTGDTSGATARIVADSDSGTTGTLTVRDIVGEFLDNEVIRDSATGVAQANGTLTSGGSVAVFGSVETIGTDQEDTAGWDVSLTAVANEVEARVTGAASTTIEWTIGFSMIKD